MESVPGIHGERRYNPKPWDYNFVLMRALARALEGLLSRHLQGKNLGTTIDFGCGTRPYEDLLSQFSEQYLGADLPDNRDADLHISPTGTVPFDTAKCDLVLSSQVLEHIIDVDSYLKECARLLRPGGYLLLSTHGMWTYHPYPVDVRRWTRWGLEHDVKARGFELIETIACVGPLAYTTQLRLQLVRGFLYQLGSIGGYLVAPISAFSQLLMRLEDRVTPKEIHDNNAAIYVLLARRL
jgi:SAM-dependent methyltransferase